MRDGDEYNGGGRDDALFANTSDNESETSNYLNIMSNGFKLRTNNGNIGGCTRMMCFREDTPRCLEYNTIGH